MRGPRPGPPRAAASRAGRRRRPCGGARSGPAPRRRPTPGARHRGPGGGDSRRVDWQPWQRADRWASSPSPSSTKRASRTSPRRLGLAPGARHATTGSGSRGAAKVTTPRRVARPSGSPSWPAPGWPARTGCWRPMKAAAVVGYAQFGPLSAYPRAQLIRDRYPDLPESPAPWVLTCLQVVPGAGGPRAHRSGAGGGRLCRPRPPRA